MGCPKEKKGKIMSHGKPQLVKNHLPKWNESSKYICFSVEFPNGEEHDIGLTSNEFYRLLKKSKKRFKLNPELGKFKTLLERLFD